PSVCLSPPVLGIEPGQIDWRPRTQEEHYPFLEHLLTTTDFRIALTQACEQSGIVLQEWEDEKELKSIHNVEYVTLHAPNGGSVRAALVPDAYFVLAREGRLGLFFLEVDLKTVTVAPSKWERRSWMRRIRTYDAYFKSESYRTRYGDRRARVVTITAGDLRLKNLKKATEEVYRALRETGEDAGAQNRFWFTVFGDDIEPGKLLAAPIWHVAGSDAPRALLE
ncbi:MAG: replication-relaxation family protein, partial [Caldilinea sp.]